MTSSCWDLIADTSSLLRIGVWSASGPLSASALVPLLASSLSRLRPDSSARVRCARCRLDSLTGLLTYVCVHAAAAVLFGFMAGTLCNFATQLKFLFGYDDCLDVRRLSGRMHVILWR